MNPDRAATKAGSASATRSSATAPSFIAVRDDGRDRGGRRRLHPRAREPQAARLGAGARARTTSRSRPSSRPPRRSPPARARRSRSPAPRSAKSRASSCATGVALVTMKVDAQVRATSTATRRCCCVPRRSCRTSRSRSTRARPSAGKLHSGEIDPPVADRPEHQLRPVPRRAGRRNARLPAGAAGRRRGRLQGQRPALVGDAQALRPDRPPTVEEIAQQLEIRHANIARSIHNFRLLMRSARRQGQAARRSSSTPPTPCSPRSPRRTRSFKSTLHAAARRAAQDGRGPRQAGHRRRRARPDAARARAVRARARPRQRSHAQARAEDHADHQERDPPVRAPDPAGRQRTGPVTQQLARSAARNSRPAFSVLNEFFNELAYNPGAEQGRLPVLPRLGQPRPQQRASAPPTRTACSAAPSCTSTATSCRSSKASRKSTRRSTCWSSLLKPPTKAGMREPGHPESKRERRRRAPHGARQAPSSASPFVEALAPEHVREARALRCRSARPPSATCS